LKIIQFHSIHHILLQYVLNHRFQNYPSKLESTKEHTSSPVHSLLAKSSLGTCGYGYLWWTKDFSINKENIQSFFATGNGGQMIFVFPRLNLVAVFTQGNYNSSLANQPFDMLTDYIIPAMLKKPQVHKN
jgi:CubicO group peptidase (beta-lactamase class C family)